MNIGQYETWVGANIPARYTFLNSLLSFLPTNQTLDASSIVWISQSPSLATFDTGSEGLVTSPKGSAAGVPNDACIGRFTMLAPGRCTVQVSVDALNPTATYVGVIQFNISAVPTP